MLKRLKQFIAGLTLRTQHIWQGQDHKVQVSYFEDNSMTIIVTPKDGASPLRICMDPNYVEKSIRWLNMMHPNGKKEVANNGNGNKVISIYKKLPIHDNERSTERSPTDPAG